MKFCKVVLLIVSAFLLFTPLNTAQAVDPTPTVVPTRIAELPDKIYLAKILDADEVENYSSQELSNNQLLTLEIVSGNKTGTRIETVLVFPNAQFKSPLKRDQQVLIQSIGDISSNAKIVIVSLYRTNNLLVLSFMLIGLFILISGFKTNIKYLQIFAITLVSGIIVLIFYHRNTYFTIGILFFWQILATFLFAFRIFRKKTPSLLLCASVFLNSLLTFGLIFIFKNIDIFDTGFFDLFFSSSYGAREIMMYILALLINFPISIVFAEQIVSEGIRKKKDDTDILKLDLIKHVSKAGIKTLNNIFLIFFGLFFGIIICVIAIASRSDIVFEVMNNASITRMLSLGFLILFNLVIFVPIVSFALGMWLGKVESHQLITDKNVNQLDL